MEAYGQVERDSSTAAGRAVDHELGARRVRAFAHQQQAEVASAARPPRRTRARRRCTTSRSRSSSARASIRPPWRAACRSTLVSASTARAGPRPRPPARPRAAAHRRAARRAPRDAKRDIALQRRPQPAEAGRGDHPLQPRPDVCCAVSALPAAAPCSLTVGGLDSSSASSPAPRGEVLSESVVHLCGQPHPLALERGRSAPAAAGRRRCRRRAGRRAGAALRRRRNRPRAGTRRRRSRHRAGASRYPGEARARRLRAV